MVGAGFGMDDYPSAILAHSKMAVVVCTTANQRLSPTHDMSAHLKVTPKGPR